MRLPADIRASLEKAMAEATAFTNDIAQKENDDAMEAMRKSGKTQIVELTPEQKAAYKSAAAKKKRGELTAMEEVASETGPVYDTKKAAEEAKASKAQPLPTRQERQADLKKAEEASAKASGSKSGIPQQ